MKIIITAKKFNVRDALREKIEKKLTKFDRYFGGDTTAKVMCSTEKDRETMEITLTYGGMVFRVQQTTNDMSASLDACIDVLERKIRKNKTRLQKRLKDGAFAVDAGYVEPESAYNLVKTKRFTVKPMDVEEAILQMEMLGHTFFLYQDPTSEEIQVIYRRADGGYGLLVPEK